MLPKARMLTAGVALGLLLLASGCALVPGTEEWTISHVAEDLELDDFGGAQCHSWYRPGFGNFNPLKLTLMIEDVANVDELAQDLEDLEFEPLVEGAEFTRNDIPNSGDYVAARLIEHGPGEAGSDLSKTDEPCIVPDDGFVEIQIFI